VEIYLIDGTYELFRHFFAVPSSTDELGREVGAVRGVLNTVRSVLERQSRYVGVATDHIIESFRNDLYAGYKTGAGIAPELFSQFPILEEELAKMGVVVWPMVEFEADDALASAAVKAAADPRVERVVICTPDKDLSQCVRGDRIVQLDRRRNTFMNEAGVMGKFGVPPESIPDYLALVGDAADGYPGIRGWGKKSASTLLARYGHIENIPTDSSLWDVVVRSAPALAETLQTAMDEALLFRTLATLRADVPVFDAVEDLHWKA